MSKLNQCETTKIFWQIHKQSRPKFSSSFIASIDISMHNYRCDGKFFECLLRSVYDQFERIEISLGDYLQRYNYVNIGHPSKGIVGELSTAKKIAIEEGDAWIERNKPTIDKLYDNKRKTPIIRRWESWATCPDITELSNMYTNFIRSDSVLNDALNKDINRLLKHRKIEVTEGQRQELALYLIEEIAVYHKQGERSHYVHVYPGGELKILKALREHEGSYPAIKYNEFIYYYLKQ